MEIVKKRSNKQPEIEEIYEAFEVIEEKGSVLAAARFLGLPKTTLYGWRDKHWREYLAIRKTRLGDKEQAREQALARLESLDHNLSKINDLFEKVQVRLREVLEDPDKVTTMAHKDMIKLMEVLIPYVAHKKEEPTPGQTVNYHTYVQNILNKIEKR